MRLYKHGSTWAFWRWTFTKQSGDYITRLHVVKTPWFAVCLHWINRPDPEPYLHDHPVTFLSIVLRGAYTEMRSVSDSECTGLALNKLVRDGFPRCGRWTRIHHVNWWNFIRADRWDAHTIIDVPRTTLTLCLMGPKRREWGYHTPSGWLHYRDYYAYKAYAKDPKEIFKV